MVKLISLKFIPILVLTAIFLAWMDSAFAQTAGQLVPRSLAPEIRQTPSGFVLPSLTNNSAPVGSEKLSLRIGNIVIDGGDPTLAGASDAIISDIRGKVVSVAELYARAAQIERLYAKKGYFLTRVTVPQQTVQQGGTLRLIVTAGFIEDIDTSAVPERVRSRVSSVLGKIKDRPKLTLNEFQRALLIAGDVVGLDLKSNLTTGKAIGAVRLLLSGSHRLFLGEVSTDNSLSAALGSWSSTLSAQLNSPLGFGEQFYFNASGSPTTGVLASDSSRRFLAIGFIAPISIDGLSFNTEYAWSGTKPIVQNAVLPTESLFQRWSFRLTYPLIRDRTDTLIIRGLLDVTNEQQTAPTFGNIYLYDDRLRVLRAGFDWTHVFETATLLSAGGDISQGLQALGSRGQREATADLPISRALGNDGFTKLEARAKFRQDLPENIAFEATARAQIALSGPLLRSEQFTLGGPRALSAYDSSFFAGDTGWLVRGELQYRSVIPVFSMDTLMVPYVFASRGQVTVLQPTAVEVGVNGATSLGGGARWTMLPTDYLRQIEFGLEGARQLSDLPTISGDQWRFNFYATVRY